jgi:hypothetical protein
VNAAAGRHVNELEAPSLHAPGPTRSFRELLEDDPRATVEAYFLIPLDRVGSSDQQLESAGDGMPVYVVERGPARARGGKT